MSDATVLAQTINNELDTMHDAIVSDDPFSWSDSPDAYESHAETYEKVSAQLKGFKYVSKAGTVWKILIFGCVLPLLIAGALFLLDIPENKEMQLWVWGGLGVVAFGSAIAAMIVADDPDISDVLSLAAYTVPRRWSFSCINGKRTWEAYAKRFTFFDRGDQAQRIAIRVWGYTDKERGRPFQLFKFFYEDVRYEQQIYTDAQGRIQTRTVRRVYPHDIHGMFATFPESKVRFRISETHGDGGLDTRISLEYGALNKAMSVYCDKKDHLEVTKFLSPAVQEVLMRASEGINGLHLDFYPGFAMVTTGEDFLDGLISIELDDRTMNFSEAIRPTGERIEGFLAAITDCLEKVKKYND
ncbi:hypothetical protein HYT05_02155 [Candidatus Kaiserbacteria bacterium]|nr:hypothetical protein [Candidatus Kaiserbacteria bacterium]